MTFLWALNLRTASKSTRPVNIKQTPTMKYVTDSGQTEVAMLPVGVKSDVVVSSLSSGNTVIYNQLHHLLQTFLSKSISLNCHFVSDKHCP